MNILRSQPDDATCRHCLDNLDQYLASQLAGEDYLSRFADIATHLDGCPDCAGAYARLYELELAEQSNQLPQPGAIPEPDLSFLNPQANVSPVALLQQAIQNLSDGFSFQLSAALEQWLRPQALPQMRQSNVSQDRYGELLLKLSPDLLPSTNPPFSMAVFKDAQQPETCLVEVTVEPPGRSWPDLGGSMVSLRFSGEEQTAVSDHNGLAVFTAVPLTELENLQILVHFPTD